MELGKPSITSVSFKDFKPLGGAMHTYVEIALLDKTQPSGMQFYEVKHNVLCLKTDFSSIHEAVHLNNDAFAYLGEVVSFDKGNKQAFLVDKTTVTYGHLVIISGPKGSVSSTLHSEEFSAGLQALIDALRVRSKIPDAFPKTIRQAHFKLNTQLTPCSFFDYTVKYGAPEIDRVVHPYLTTTKPDITTNDLNTTHRRLYEVQI